jgi:hypothetical protein
MSRPVAISVGEISKAAKATVEKALSGHKAAFPVIPPHRIGFVPATEVHVGIAGSVASVQGGKPGVICGDGNLTIGFAPPTEINLIEQ